MMSQSKVTPDERDRMIAEAAYYKAEQRGFAAGDTVRDWCEAEAEVDARLRRLEIEQWLDRLEDGMAAAAKRISALKRKMTGLSSEARTEWQRDLDRLKNLREDLRPTLAELRKQGEDAGARLRDRAEKLRAEIAEVVAKVAARKADH
jgi:predicted  nucleic acid-binding Zn-ribbon protein